MKTTRACESCSGSRIGKTIQNQHSLGTGMEWIINIIHNLNSVACYPTYMTHNHQNPGTWQGKLWWTSRGGEVQSLHGPERSGMEICGLAGSKYYIQQYSSNLTIGFMIIRCWQENKSNSIKTCCSLIRQYFFQIDKWFLVPQRGECPSTSESPSGNILPFWF